MRDITLDDIDKMPAGPEMDALIAKVGGFEVLGFAHCEPGYEGLGYIYIDGCLEVVKPYSTTDHEAILILEVLYDQGWEWELSHSWGENWFECHLSSGPNDQIAYGDTLSLAICRAVLKVIIREGELNGHDNIARS